MAKRKKTDYGVDWKRFAEAWETSNSAQEVADRLGMPKPIVLARASGYRRKGMNLKDMPRHPKNAVDVREGNEFIANLRKAK